MTAPTPRRLPALLLLLATLPTFAADVRATQDAQSLSLANGHVTLRIDARTHTLTATSHNNAFLQDATVTTPDAVPALANRLTPLGPAKSLEFTHPDGTLDRITLLADSPFVLLQHSPRNATDQDQFIDKLTPFQFPLAKTAPLADLRVLGCDGLTRATDPRASYTFLAAADPATRAGVVAAWLTNDRASGIVTSTPTRDLLTISARSEYGRLLLKPGESAEGETFVIGRFDDALQGLEAYADLVAKHYQIKLKPNPSGYCTWYARPHGGAADEKSLKELAAFAHDTLAPFGFNLIQIDDKWQLSNRDYTTHKPTGPYPSGMKATADTLHSLGMTPGLWFIPFGWDPKSPTFADKQDYFVHRNDGTLYEVKWAGTCLDMTHPGARDLLRETVARITRDWGYKYLKLDGLWTGMATQILYPNPAVRDDHLGDALFHDPKKTNIEAYRDGLKLVRQAAGDDVFITGCNVAQNMRTLAASFGLVDALRVGRDIGASWEKILPSMTMGTRLYFFHGRTWHNDPDCLMLRDPLTIDQARAWASWIAISGQLNLVSEWLPGLPPDRLDLVKRSMPNTGLCGRPLDLFEHNDPRIWKLSSGTGESRRDLVALFNWDPKASAEFEIPLEKLDLPPAKSYTAFDYWPNQFLPPLEGALKLTLHPASCRVLSIRPTTNDPQVLSTSRHITQGIIDLANEHYDPTTRTLTGTSRVIANDPYELRIVANPTAPIADVKLSPADQSAGVTAATTTDDPAHPRVTLRSTQSRAVQWAITFK